MLIQRAAIFGTVQKPGGAALISRCLVMAPVCLGRCVLDVRRSAFWPIAWRTMACFLPPAFLACVIRIASRLSRFFYPCRQQLQIEKIDSLNGRLGHRLHVPRMATEANVKNLGKDGPLRSLKASEYIAARCLSRK